MDNINISHQVKSDTGWQFEVVVGTAPDVTFHTVTLSQKYWQTLTSSKTSPEELIVKSFVFLLKHEPKKSILPQFDLPAINTYFPNYEEIITRQLTST